jgi:hypothetical protein
LYWKTAAARAIWPTLSVLSRRSLLSMLREDGIRMALSRGTVIRFPYSEDSGYIKRFGEKRKEEDQASLVR